MSQNQASITFGFSRSSIWKYLKEYKASKEKSFQYKRRGVKAGTGSKMTQNQIEELKSKILSHTPDELGMQYTLWNSKVIRSKRCGELQLLHDFKRNPREVHPRGF